MRSRAVLRPFACCFSTAFADPACTASSRRRSRSASLPAVVWMSMSCGTSVPSPGCALTPMASWSVDTSGSVRQSSAMSDSPAPAPTHRPRPAGRAGRLADRGGGGDPVDQRRGRRARPRRRGTGPRAGHRAPDRRPRPARPRVGDAGPLVADVLGAAAPRRAADLVVVAAPADRVRRPGRAGRPAARHRAEVAQRRARRRRRAGRRPQGRRHPGRADRHRQRADGRGRGRASTSTRPSTSCRSRWPPRSRSRPASRSSAPACSARSSAPSTASRACSTTPRRCAGRTPTSASRSAAPSTSTCRQGTYAVARRSTSTRPGRWWSGPTTARSPWRPEMSCTSGRPSDMIGAWPFRASSSTRANTSSSPPGRTSRR